MNTCIYPNIPTTQNYYPPKELKNILSNKIFLCGSCGIPSFFNKSPVLDNCCDGRRGIDDFNCLIIHDNKTKDGDEKTFITTFSTCTATATEKCIKSYK